MNRDTGCNLVIFFSVCLLSIFLLCEMSIEVFANPCKHEESVCQRLQIVIIQCHYTAIYI